MNFKFLLVFVSTVMLAACGKPDTGLDSVQVVIATKKSSTAIIFPGGGIDFGFKPVSTRVELEENNRVLIVNYFEFDLSLSDLKNAVDEVMKQQGYKVHLVDKRKRELYDSVVSYKKKGSGSIYFKYSNVVKEGFYKKTQMFVSWYK